MKYGYGKNADELLAQFAADISENPGFKNIAVFSIDDETTICRGLDTQRLDGFGITKAHVTTAKSELRKLGLSLTFDEVDGLLHHAVMHHDDACDCETGTRPPTTSAERMRAKRARDRNAGFCNIGGTSHGLATRGAICERCYQYGLARKKVTRAAKRAP